MEIKNSEWTDFAEFIARQSEHMCSQYWEDGTYFKCPFSTMERAYAAFSIWQSCHSQTEVAKFYDVNFEVFNPEKGLDEWQQAQMEEALEYERLQRDLEHAFKEAAGMVYFGVDDWNPEWDYYCADREKQIIRIAHELADKHENLHVFGDKSWMSLVYPFYEKYELNSDERCLFTQEYYSQHFFRYGYV